MSLNQKRGPVVRWEQNPLDPSRDPFLPFGPRETFVTTRSPRPFVFFEPKGSEVINTKEKNEVKHGLTHKKKVFCRTV